MAWITTLHISLPSVPEITISETHLLSLCNFGLLPGHSKHTLHNPTIVPTFQTHSNWTSHMGPSFYTASFDLFPPRFAIAHKHIPTHSLTHKHIQGHHVQSHPLPAIKATFVLTVASGLPGIRKRGSGRLYPLYPLFSLHLFSEKQQKEPAVELMLLWMVTTVEMTAALWP